MSVDYDVLMADLIRDESYEQFPYKDTKGLLTIGIGRNLEEVGISEDEAKFLARNNVIETEADLDRNVPWWRGLPEPAARGLVNMGFNLGWPVLSTFKLTLGALERGDWLRAHDEVMYRRPAEGDFSPSTYRQQVGARATRIAKLFKKGTN